MKLSDLSDEHLTPIVDTYFNDGNKAAGDAMNKLFASIADLKSFEAEMIRHKLQDMARKRKEEGKKLPDDRGNIGGS